jgi:hypothetical protein
MKDPSPPAPLCAPKSTPLDEPLVGASGSNSQETLLYASIDEEVSLVS